MADESVTIRDASRASVSILSDEVVERNGMAVVSADRAQIVKAAYGSDGVVTDITPQTPLPIGDMSPPLVALTQGGASLAGSGNLAVAANPARVKIDVMNPTAVRVWLGIGAPAVADAGIFLDPSSCFTEYTQDAVYGVSDDGSASSLTFVEWGT